MMIDLNGADQLPPELQVKVREAVEHLERLRAAYSLAASRNLGPLHICCINALFV